MPDDEVTSQDEVGGESREEEATPTDKPDTLSGKAVSKAPPPDEADILEEHQGETPSTGSGEDKEQAAPAPEAREQPPMSAQAYAKWLLEFHRSMDPQRNKETSPPSDERAALRSVTLGEVYIGQEIDALIAAFQKITWVNVDKQFADEIAQARDIDEPYSSQFLLLSGPVARLTMNGYEYGTVSLPAGTERIAGNIYVLGPSMVSLVLTFILAAPEGSRLDKVLRDNATSELRESNSGRFDVRTVFQVKYGYVQDLLNEVGEGCLSWLKEWAMGTLGKGDGAGVPLCSLISLAQGKPFEALEDSSHPPEYMRLLDLVGNFAALKFARPDYLFLKPRRDRKRHREFVGIFNEIDTAASYPNLSDVPEIFHQAISSYMIALTLEGVLRIFESRMRHTRSDLASLNFNKVPSPPLWDKLKTWLTLKPPAESPVAGLRDHLLSLSRDIAVVSGDIKGVIDNNTLGSIWADYPLLLPLDPNMAQPSMRDPAVAPRQNIIDSIANLKIQETELRELVLVTSQTASETQDKKTQTTLNRLTVWLVAFTVLLVIIGIFTIWKTFYDSPDSSTPKPAASTSAPAAKPSPRPTPMMKVSKKASHSPRPSTPSTQQAG